MSLSCVRGPTSRLPSPSSVNWRHKKDLATEAQRDEKYVSDKTKWKADHPKDKQAFVKSLNDEIPQLEEIRKKEDNGPAAWYISEAINQARSTGRQAGMYRSSSDPEAGLKAPNP